MIGKDVGVAFTKLFTYGLEGLAMGGILVISLTAAVALACCASGIISTHNSILNGKAQESYASKIKDSLMMLLPQVAFGLCFGYGAVHIAITPLLQEAGFSLAATITAKCAISSVIGFAFGYLGSAVIDKSDMAFKDKLLECNKRVLYATTAAFGAMAAAILPEAITKAVGMNGDVGIAFEVFVSVAAIAAVVLVFYGAAVLYHYHNSYWKDVANKSLQPALETSK